MSSGSCNIHAAYKYCRKFLKKHERAQKRTESRSVVNCHWPNKLDSVVGSRLDVDNYVIVLHPHPPAHLHPYTGTFGGVGGVGWTFNDTAHVDSEAWCNSDIVDSAPDVQNLNVELDDVTTWDHLEEKMLQTLLVTFYVLL